MATQVPPKKGAAFDFYCFLTSQANPLIFQANPTLATGDAKVSIDGGAFANLATLPDVDPNSGVAVKVSLSAAEMAGDNIQVTLIDAAGAQWCDIAFNIQTVDRQINDLAFPNTSARGIDVTATGGVGIDWSNVEAPTTALALTGTTIATSQVVASVTGNVGGNVTGSVGSVATGGIAAASFAAGAINAAALATDAVNEIRDAIFARAYGADYGAFTFEEITQIIVAACGGKASGLNTTSVAYRNLDDSATVIAATVDASGNRTAVTLTP